MLSVADFESITTAKSCQSEIAVAWTAGVTCLAHATHCPVEAFLPQSKRAVHRTYRRPRSCSCEFSPSTRIGDPRTGLFSDKASYMMTTVGIRPLILDSLQSMCLPSTTRAAILDPSMTLLQKASCGHEWSRIYTNCSVAPEEEFVLIRVNSRLHLFLQWSHP